MPQFRNIFRAGAVLIFARLLRAPKRQFFSIFIPVFVFTVISFFPISASAIVGPNCAPTDANCNGSLSIDANRNLGFNTFVVGTTTGATPPYGNFSKVFMIAATSSPPGLGLRSVATGCPPEGCSSQPLYPATWVWRLTPWGFMELVNATDSTSYNAGPVMTFMGGGSYNRRVTIGNFYTATSSQTEALNVIGNVKANSFVGNLSGSVSAGNVTGPSAFGINYGTYNFAAPGAFAIGTSTTVGLPSNGLYVAGNVGIGTANPGYPLEVYGVIRTNSSIVANSLYTNTIRASNDAVNINITNNNGTLTALSLNPTSGNVGVGTTGPTTKLQIDSTADQILSLYRTSAGTGAGIGVSFDSYNSNNTKTNYARIYGNESVLTAGSESGYLQFYTTNSGTPTEKVRITSTGNVGIGTTAPAGRLDVGGGNIVNVGTPTNAGDAATKSYVDSVVGGGGQWTATSTGIFYGSGNVGVGTASPDAKLHVSSSQTSSYNALILENTNAGAIGYGTNLVFRILDSGHDLAKISGTLDAINAGGLNFFTTNSASAGMTQQMKITSTGNVGIGTTSPAEKLVINSPDGTSLINQFTIRENTDRYGKYTFSQLTSGAFANQYLSLDIINNVGTFNNTMVWSGANVGIATTTPSYKLDVVGGGQFSQPVIVGTPTATNHATTKSYVDSMFTGSGQWTTNGGVVYLTSTTQNVGIGTTAPGRLLNVVGSNTPLQVEGNTTGNAFGTNLVIKNTNTDANQYVSHRVSLLLYGYDYPGTTLLYSGLQSENGNLNIVTQSGNIILSPTGDLYSIQNSVIPFRSVTSGAVANTLYLKQGNVGIGTTGPGVKLQIGDTTAQVTAKIAGGGVNKAPVLSLLNSGSREGFIGQTTDALYIGNTNGLANFNDATMAAGANLTIMGTGNVGIGTTSPLTKLDITGDVRATTGFRIGSAVNGTTGQFVTDGTDTYLDYGGTLKFRYNAGTENVRITSTGNVGIATTTPSYKLDVVGAGQFSQPVIVGTPTATNHATTKSYVDSMFSGSGQWTTNGGVVYLTSTTQNVGIGTTAPSVNLEVNGGSSWIPMQVVSTNSTGTGYNILPNGGFPGWMIWAGNPNNATFGNKLLFSTTSGLGNSTEKMTLTSTGSLGIGTTGPGAKLDVSVGYGTTTGLITSLNGYGTKVGAIWSGSATIPTGVLSLYYGATSNIQLNSETGQNSYINAGNVGIATTTPSYKLDVVGTSQFSQPVIVGTPTAATHATTKSYVDSMFSGSGQWTTNGGVVYLTSTTQNVGIGTAAPQNKVSIVSSVTSSSTISDATSLLSLTNKYGGAVDEKAAIAWKNAAVSGSPIGAYISSNFKNALGQGETDLYFGTRNDSGVLANRMIIDRNGNVGIGTTAPTKKLQIEGDFGVSYNGTSNFNVSTYGYATQRSAWITQLNGTGDHGNVPLSIIADVATTRTANYFNVSNISGTTGGIFTIYKDGNVGIGTTVPVSKLDVSGIIRTNNAMSIVSGNPFLIFDNTGYASADYQIYENASGTLNFYTNIDRVSILSSGNVGIATTTPSYKLDVVGTSQFSQPVIVGTPTNASHAATKSYVDSIVGGGAGTGSFSTLTVSGTSTLSGNWQLGGASLGNVNMNGFNIVGVNKITASVIDPIYSIDGIKYATYGSDTIGIKTEMFGKVTLTASVSNDEVGISNKTSNELIKNSEIQSKFGNQNSPPKADQPRAEKFYSYTIDFSKVERGSDLWLFWQTINAGQNMKDVTVSLTPEFDGRVWYELLPAKKQIVIYGEISNLSALGGKSQISNPTVSYHLVAPRHDATQWGNRVKNQQEEASFILKTK